MMTISNYYHQPFACFLFAILGIHLGPTGRFTATFMADPILPSYVHGKSKPIRRIFTLITGVFNVLHLFIYVFRNLSLLVLSEIALKKASSNALDSFCPFH